MELYLGKTLINRSLNPTRTGYTGAWYFNSHSIFTKSYSWREITKGSPYLTDEIIDPC